MLRRSAAVTCLRAFVLVAILVIASAVPVWATEGLTFTSPPDQSISASDAAAYQGRPWFSLGSFSDSSAAGPWVASVAWGDGTETSFAAAPGALTYPHAFLPGTYSVSVTVTNAAGASAAGAFSATISGDLVVGTVDSAITTNEGIPTSVVFYPYDPYLPWDAPIAGHVDYGDGTGEDVAAQNGAGIAVTHTFRAHYEANPAIPWDAGTVYRVTFTLTDAAGRSASGTVVVAAANVPPVLIAVPATISEDFASDPNANWVTIATFTDASVGPWYVHIDGGADYRMDETLTSPGPIQVPWVGYLGSHAFIVSVADWPGLTTQVFTSITVTNTPPVVSDARVIYGNAGSEGPVVAVATWSDFGSAAETGAGYTCSVDYGDGSGAQPGIIAGDECQGYLHWYAAEGEYTATVTVTDPEGASASATVVAIPVNLAPAVSGALPTLVQAGEAWSASVRFTDQGSPENGGIETYTCTVDYGDGSGRLPGVVGDGTCFGPLHAYSGSGTYQVVAAVTDSRGATGAYSQPVVAFRPAPIVGPVAAPGVVGAGTSMSASATYVPTGMSPADTCTIDYGDGGAAVAAIADGAICLGPSHAYARAGTFRITATVTAWTGARASSAATIVVYDPARVVTATGTFVSPSGACRLSPKCAKAANASFTLKASYAKGATTPSVAFTLSLPAFAFSATRADWLVAVDGSATLQGTGKLNGVAGYQFVVRAVDGSPDSIAISIADATGVVVYDSAGQVPLKSGSVAIR